jgi:hypothetical protein
MVFIHDGYLLYGTRFSTACATTVLPCYCRTYDRGSDASPDKTVMQTSDSATVADPFRPRGDSAAETRIPPGRVSHAKPTYRTQTASTISRLKSR